MGDGNTNAADQSTDKRNCAGVVGGRRWAGREESIPSNGCFPLDSSTFDKFKIADEKVEGHGRPRATMYMCINMDRQQSRLYATMYGEEHLQFRSEETERINDIIEDCPEFFTANFRAETWGGRMTSQYNICVAAGVRRIIGHYGERITLVKLKTPALIPLIGFGTSWRYTPLFDFDTARRFLADGGFPRNSTGGEKARRPNLIIRTCEGWRAPRRRKEEKGRECGDERNGGDEGKIEAPNHLARRNQHLHTHLGPR